MQEEEIQAIKEGFEAKYPQITMNYFFAGTNKVLTKLATEIFFYFGLILFFK